ncbi:phospholipase DDHD1-like isoform X2 [Lineus longissimus]|uniref:phospholipase DDHD1-like isoform X2 n=1 Tax=Lineus longissimus TaxID=88925 RepID=UPI00315C9C63
MEFPAPADGKFHLLSEMDNFGDPLSASERSSYCGEDDGSYMDDASSEISDISCQSETRPRRRPSYYASRRRYLYPKIDNVEPLNPEQVRWFYREVRGKKWSAFIGYDSLRIECKYRELHYGTGGTHEENVEMIVVRGGLYEADVVDRKCYPIYWTEMNEIDIMRGTWFLDSSWQPVEEGYASQIETEHLANFENETIPDEPLTLTKSKGQKKAIHHMHFKDFHVDWYAINEVFLYSEATSSRLYRRVGNTLGLQKSTGGSKLHRGYYAEAKPDDKPPDITHLVFVIHGIGQKMETGSIIKSCADLRESVAKMKSKYFSRVEESNQRAEFLPVEWRSTLKLDGDTVDSITPSKVRGLRTILNSSAMDILYYTSPLYRSEITHGLQTELNRLYSMFCARHPYFEANRGKVSIVAHSLGCVITYDIIMGWNPIQLYDQYVANVIEEQCSQADGASGLISELEKARKRVSELEVELLSLAERQHLKVPTLKFREGNFPNNVKSGPLWRVLPKLENFFCLGSPLAVFLALRGVRPKGNGTQDHILPRHICNRLFNIYHPADPVAYRLEPLILKHYATVLPLKCHRCEASKQESYQNMKAEAYAPFAPKEKEKKKEEKNNNTSEPRSAKDKIGNVWARFSRRQSDDLTAEMERIESSAKEIEDRLMEKAKAEAERTPSPEVDHTDLEFRLDYQLQEGSLENSYISVLTSHTSYWQNTDVALFILTSLHPEHRPTTS